MSNPKKQIDFDLFTSRGSYGLTIYGKDRPMKAFHYIKLKNNLKSVSRNLELMIEEAPDCVRVLIAQANEKCILAMGEIDQEMMRKGL